MTPEPQANLALTLIMPVEPASSCPEGLPGLSKFQVMVLPALVAETILPPVPVKDMTSIPAGMMSCIVTL